MGLFAAGSYELTPSDRPVSGACPSRADVSTSGQSTWTSAGLDGVRPGSGTHPHDDQFALRNGGPSAAYVNPRCRVVGPTAAMRLLSAAQRRQLWQRREAVRQDGRPSGLCTRRP